MNEEKTEAVQDENQEADQDENQSLLNVEIENKEEDNKDDGEPSTNHLTKDDDNEPTPSEEEAKEEEEKKIEKPDYVSVSHWDNNKGEVKTEELARAYHELRNKMSTGKHKPPKDGEYKKDFADGLKEDELVGKFTEIAKDNNFSQELYEELINFFIDSQGEVEQEIKYSKEKELKKLGNKAESIIKSTNSWLQKFGDSKVLTPDEVNAVAKASTSSYFISALNKIRRSYNEQTIPSVNTHETSKTSMEDLQDMMKDPRYGKDDNFTKKVEKMVYEFHGEKYV